MGREELVEILAETVHDVWMETKKAQGVSFRRSEWDEQLMAPYMELSEPAKELDRVTVRGVLDALEANGFTVVDGSGEVLWEGQTTESTSDWGAYTKPTTSSIETGILPVPPGTFAVVIERKDNP